MEKYNITHLLQGTIILEETSEKIELSGIEIPIIQRDYAQGRLSESSIRNRFLKSIFTAMVKEEELELDFVYGSIKTINRNDNKISLFMPLDGQQRLTTIFLLRWYIANKELDGEALAKERELLSNFSYSTRSTARMFCEKLSQIGFEKNPVTEIVSAYWYHKSFELDPTVQGMLNTLADIQIHYNQLDEKTHQNLDKLKFYVLPLDGFDLSDELYIKMNARGKPLTDFENFKADWINWMKSEENSEVKLYNEEVKLGNTDMPKYLSIASQLDNYWTDIFWPVAKGNVKNEDKVVDMLFLRLIGRFCLNQFITTSQFRTQEIEKSGTFKLFYSNSDFLKYDSFDDYKSLLTIEKVNRLEKVLNAIHLNQNEIRAAIKPMWDAKYDWFLFDTGITQIQRILFFAIEEYLARNDFDKERFGDWMRIVWNLIADPDIRSIAVMISTMKSIYLLANESSRINESLLNEEFEQHKDEFSKIQFEQLLEEKLKLEKFAEHDWKEIILELEGHPLFQGSIGFIINDNPELSLFKNRAKNALLMFRQSGTSPDFDINNRVLRFCISRLSNWEEIYGFTYSDDSRNWQLMLRRNPSVKNSISELCSLDETQIQNAMKLAIESPSSSDGMDDLNRLRVIHQNLYQYNDFFTWTQRGEKLTDIKELNGYFYLIRKRAWHDKVLVDGFRNEIINKFCELAELHENQNRCDNTHFFWGENIVFTKKIDGTDFKIVFNRHNHVEIRKLVKSGDENVWEQTYYDEGIIDSAHNNNEAEQNANQIWNLLTEV